MSAPTCRSTSADHAPTELPERLLIYHAGTGRTAFLAFWKITSVFSCAFFCLVAAPSYIRAEDKTLTQAAGLAACGIIPLLFVAYTSAPFVTYIYLRLPPYARQSRALLERYVRTLPPTAQLELGTMGLATRPRTTLVSAADLRPVSPEAAGGSLATRFGLVTHVRDVSALMAKRKWHHYRPVSQFGIREDLASGGGAKSGGGGGKGASHGVKDGWVWNIVRESLGKRR
ncbi:paired amphipathic helix protein [Colletotrichum tofieldiae]|nr:paired amphipathic helix protein [Colletotrichum tofieldiae]GKT74508.1 paired amphipathic helix protein [Colletotrichum tofieldiae]